MKSKSVNLWPIQCFIIELPPKLRYCFAYILVCGLLWCPKKSNLNIFQERFASELEQTQNFQVQIEEDSVNIVIERINLHGHLADLVSKAPYLCFCQFSGKNECSVCLHPGEKRFSKEGGVSTFIHTKTRNPLVEHMRKHFCMQGQLREQKRRYLGWKVCRLFHVFWKFQVKSY